MYVYVERLLSCEANLDKCISHIPKNNMNSIELSHIFNAELLIIK